MAACAAMTELWVDVRIEPKNKWAGPGGKVRPGLARGWERSVKMILSEIPSPEVPATSGPEATAADG
jgi:hypothetical protein